MSDPNVPPASGYGGPGGHPQQGSPQQGGYPQQGYPGPGYPGPGPGGTPADYPGKTLGIVGLVLSFFTTVIGLIVSIVALRQSKKAGFKNTPALIGVIIGIVTTLLAVIVGTIAVLGVMAVLDQCAELGPGVHEINGIPITCG